MIPKSLNLDGCIGLLSQQNLSKTQLFGSCPISGIRSSSLAVNDGHHKCQRLFFLLGTIPITKVRYLLQ